MTTATVIIETRTRGQHFATYAVALLANPNTSAAEPLVRAGQRGDVLYTGPDVAFGCEAAAEDHVIAWAAEHRVSWSR